jgi:hypothetical protein
MCIALSVVSTVHINILACQNVRVFLVLCNVVNLDLDPDSNLSVTFYAKKVLNNFRLFCS